MTGLPADNSQWPPAHVRAQYDRMPLLQAWHSGDRQQLQSVYGSNVSVVPAGPPTTLNPQGTPASTLQLARAAFWGGRSNLEEDTRRHYGLGGQLARKSAALLFSEPLRVRVQGPVYETDGPKDQQTGEPQWSEGDPMPETLRAQRRLELLLERCQFSDLLLQTAEISAVLGWAGLRVVYDQTALPDRPIIAREFADATVPVYSWGQLVGVMFWRVLPAPAGVGASATWRHLEFHDRQGSVWHGLYKGSSDSLGTRQPLTEHAALAGIAELASTAPEDYGRIEVVPGAVTAVSVPNLLPDPMDYRNNAGRSDFTPEVLEMFETADKIFTDMMDAEDDAKSRLLVSDAMLNFGKPGQGVGFNPNQRVFTRLNVPPSEREGGGLPIEKVQFEMHAEEYRAQLDAAKRDAYEIAGYNPRNDKGSNGRDVTATEVRSDDDADLQMRDTKVGYWRPRLNELLTGLLMVDVAKFRPTDPEDGQLVKAYPVVVEFPEAIQPSGEELANEAKTRKDAGAISTYQAVRDTRPTWSAKEVADEVERIESAAQAIDPVTLGAQTGDNFGPGDGV